MKKLLATTILGLFVVTSLTLSTATAQTPSVCDNPGVRPEICNQIDGGKTGTASSNPVITTLRNIIGLISYVVGAASLIMVFVGSIKYMISTGDAQSISSAKNTVMYALVGLAVALLAQAIVRFILVRL